jgi:hypothetical protein
LYYYKARGEIVPTGYIDLAKCGFDFCTSGDGDYGCCFDIITNAKTYRFKGPSSHETRHWARIFDTIKRELLDNSKSRIRTRDNETRGTFGSSSSSSESLVASEASSASDWEASRLRSLSSGTELDTFGHLRLKDAVGRIKNSPQLDQRPLIDAKQQCHIDIQGLFLFIGI